VPERRAVLGAQRVLEPRAERAREDVDDQRLVVDVDDARQPAEVEHDATVQRNARAADAAPPCRRRHWDARVVAHPQHRRYLVCRPRPRHCAGARGDLPVERPDHRQRPPVSARFRDHFGVDGHVGARRPQARQHLVVDGDRGRGEVRADVGHGSTERDRWRRLPGRAHCAG
jgi:hypothetical protein